MADICLLILQSLRTERISSMARLLTSLKMRSCGENRGIGKIAAMISGSLSAQLYFRPSEFVKKTGYRDDGEEDLSTAGKMPPDNNSESEV